MKPTKSYYDNYAKQAITEALLKMMDNTYFDDISITELCKQANIARRTFYLYFDSKMDVLDDYYTVLTREYDNNIPDDIVFDTYGQILYFFKFWYDHQSYLQILYRQKLFYILLNRFSDYLTNRSKHENDIDISSYSFSYSSGGLWATLYNWTKEKFNETPEKLAQAVYDLQAK